MRTRRIRRRDVTAMAGFPLRFYEDGERWAVVTRGRLVRMERVPAREQRAVEFWDGPGAA